MAVGFILITTEVGCEIAVREAGITETRTLIGAEI